MDDIIKKVYSHFLSDTELLEKEKDILSLNDLKKFNHVGYRSNIVDIYYNKNYFIKIERRQTNQQNYILEKKSLMLGKFPKEIIINNILRKELKENIVEINNYYFNNSKQIIVMENVGITLKELFMKKINNIELINDKIYEIFVILTILQNKFKFMHKDLHSGNILMKKVETEFNNYIIDNKEYKIKSYGYIPVFIDFGYSTIFKIYSNEFEIYNTHKTRFKCITKYDKIIDSDTFKYKYFWYIRDKNKFEQKLEAMTDRYTCKKCKSKRCSYYQLQTRSADEGITTYITCLDCGQRMKFN